MEAALKDIPVQMESVPLAVTVRRRVRTQEDSKIVGYAPRMHIPVGNILPTPTNVTWWFTVEKLYIRPGQSQETIAKRKDTAQETWPLFMTSKQVISLRALPHQLVTLWLEDILTRRMDFGNGQMVPNLIMKTGKIGRAHV